MVTRQPDGKALVQRDQLPARQRASKLQRREEKSAFQRESFRECSPFKQTDFSTDWASSNQIVLVGRSPAHVFWDIQ